MRRTLLHIFMLYFCTIVLATCTKPSDDTLPQPVAGERYLEQIFPLFNRYRDLPYGENYTQSGVLKQLHFDFFEPRDDDELRRPLIVMAKGFGFVDVGREDFDLLAELLVSFGYTVASLDYRVDDRLEFPIDSVSSYDNIIKARADIKAAIRMLRLEAQGQNRFRTDPDRIFLLGYSAGAVAALHAAYFNQGDPVSPLLDSLIAQNGGWEGDSGPAFGNSRPTAVVNLSGALLDADYIDETEPPLLSIHGQEDAIVPICEGPFTLEEFLEPFAVEGSCRLHERALEIGLASTIIAPAQGKHDAPFNDVACENCIARIVFFLYEFL